MSSPFHYVGKNPTFSRLGPAEAQTPYRFSFVTETDFTNWLVDILTPMTCAERVTYLENLQFPFLNGPETIYIMPDNYPLQAMQTRLDPGAANSGIAGHFNFTSDIFALAFQGPGAGIGGSLLTSYVTDYFVNVGAPPFNVTNSGQPFTNANATVGSVISHSFLGRDFSPNAGDYDGNNIVEFSGVMADNIDVPAFMIIHFPDCQGGAPNPPQMFDLTNQILEFTVTKECCC